MGPANAPQSEEGEGLPKLPPVTDDVLHPRYIGVQDPGYNYYSEEKAPQPWEQGELAPPASICSIELWRASTWA